MLETITIAVSEIQEGDEFHAPLTGDVCWIALEPSVTDHRGTSVQVQHWPDGGIGPPREWIDSTDTLTIRRPIPAEKSSYAGYVTVSVGLDTADGDILTTHDVARVLLQCVPTPVTVIREEAS